MKRRSSQKKRFLIWQDAYVATSWRSRIFQRLPGEIPGFQLSKYGTKNNALGHPEKISDLQLDTSIPDYDAYLEENFFWKFLKEKTLSCPKLSSTLSQSPFTDQQLLELLDNESSKAMELIFRRHFAGMVQVVHRMIRDQGRAEDLVQDVFLKFWKQKDQLNIKISLKAYLRRSCVNACLDDIRKQKKHQFVDTETILPIAADPQPDAAKQLANNELEQIINQTIDNLAPKCRTVFLLSRKEQLSNKEIAEKLGVTLKTVEAHITTALKRLRTVIKNNRI